MVPALLMTTAGILATLALVVLSARPTNSINQWFAAYAFGMSLWALAIGMIQTGLATEAWARLSFAAASGIPACFFAFTRAYPTWSRWPPHAVVRGVLMIGGALSVLSLTTPWLVHDTALTPTGFTRKSGPLYPVFTFYFLVVWLSAFAVFVTKWRQARGQARAQLQYLGLALLISFGGGISTNLLIPFLLGRAAQTWIGPLFTLPLVALVGHAIIRHRLMDLRLIVHRGTVLVTITAALSAAGLIVIRVIDSRAFTNVGPRHLSALVIAGATLTVILGLLVPRIGRSVDRYLLRGRIDYDRVLVEATRRFRRLMQPADLARELQRILEETVAPERIVLLVKAERGGRWTCLLDGADNEDGFDPSVQSLAWRLPGSAPSLVVLDAVARDERDQNSVGATLRAAGAEVWMAFGHGEHRLGIMLLGSRRSGDAYHARELEFLEDLDEIVTGAFEMAELHQRQLALERDRERDAHLARMAQLYAGLAHEIRTPLTTLSNLVSVIPDRFDDPEFRQLLVQLVPPEIARIAGLTQKLSDLAPGSAPTDRVALHALLDRVAAFARPAARERGVEIHVAVDPGLPAVMGDDNRLIQLFTNLLQNAVEATPKGGHVWIRAHANGASVRVEILDEGPGIDPKIQDRMCEPFVTTKPSGMGLGLSICREIVHAHQAELTIENRTDQPGAKVEVVFHVLPRS